MKEREAKEGLGVRAGSKIISTADIMGVEGSAAEERDQSRKSNDRPRVERRWQDSERTVTGR